MALLSKTQESYYNISQSFSGNGSTKVFKLKQNSRSSQSIISEINELVEDTDVEEVSDDHYEYMVNADE